MAYDENGNGTIPKRLTCKIKNGFELKGNPLDAKTEWKNII